MKKVWYNILEKVGDIMQDLIVLLTQNGIGVVCVAFMIYFINTTMKDNNKILDEIQKTLVSIQTTLTIMTQRVDELEHKTNDYINYKKKGDE